MKRLLFISFLAMMSYTHAQETDFRKLLTEIQASLTEVKAGEKTYGHELELLHTSVVKYKLTVEDAKGNREASIFEFNISDLDPYLVKEETKRDVIYLNLTVDNEQKFIKEYLNEEVKGYEASISLVTSDIDNARKIKELIKEAIPLAKEIMAKKLSIQTYDAMKEWLANNIKGAESANKSYEQKLSVNDRYPGSFRLTQTTITSRSSIAKRYDFNLADVNVNSLKFNIIGSSLSLTFETKRKQDVIKEYEINSPSGFDDKIEIFTNNVEEARDLKNVLTMAVPFAEEQAKAAIEVPKSKQAAFESLSKYVKEVNHDGDVIEQKLSGNCIQDFSTIEDNTKATETHTYVFNLMDIDPNSIDVGVTSNKMFVKASTHKNIDLIKDFENETFDRFSDDIKIYVEDIEIARRLMATFKTSIDLCMESYQDPFINLSNAKRIDWLVRNLGEVRVNEETITQRFEQSDETDPDKFKLKKSTVGSKSSTDEIFEFNFSDLDANSIQYKIRGKSLAVTFKTKFGENIIKYYKDGEIENYKNGFDLDLVDIEEARKVIRVFNLIIADLND